MEDLIDYQDDYDDFLIDINDTKPDEGKKQQKREKSSIPGHLASPIYGEEILMLLNNDKQMFKCFRHRKIKDFLNTNKITKCYKDFNDPISVIQSWAKRQVGKTYRDEYTVSIKASSNWIAHKYHFNLPSLNGGIIHKEEYLSCLRNKFSEVERELEKIYIYYEQKRIAEEIKDEICFKDIDMGSFLQWKGSFFERDMSILNIDGSLTIFPTTQVIGALDKLQALFGLKMYWKLADVFNRYPNHSIYDRGSFLIDKIGSLRSKLDQDFFSFCSTFEALTLGWVVNRDEDIGCRKLFDTQRKECEDILNKHGVKFELDSILPTGDSTDDILLGLELTGISKIFGYPTLEADKLLDQLKQYAVRNKFQPDLKTLLNVEAVMRREFVLNFRSKHGYYPIITSAPSQLMECISKNKPIQKNTLKDYDLWAYVRFGKTLEYDFCPDFYELVKDSAAAVNLSAWGTMYDSCAFNILYGKSPPPSSNEKVQQPRRVIQAFLTANEDEIRKQINLREKGIYSEEDHISVQCGKECEQKPYHGRAFTKQTTNQRFNQTSMEHNIAHKVFPYVPEQSMIDGEVRNLNRILQQIRDMGETAEFICLDLKKWCLFQRHQTTVFAGRMYDELFGLNGIFENSHNFFLGCNVFCNSRLSPPDFDEKGKPIPGPYFMNDLIGGLEGLQQKKWTHITEAAIKLSAEMCNQKVTIMGQGDNQVILLHFNKHEQKTSENRRNMFLNTLDSIFKNMNHELKEKETWYSKFLHEYSKVRNFKGIAVSNGTKKSSSLVPEINDGLCSLHSSLSTINTMTEAIARADYDSDPAFLINQILLASYIQRKKMVKISYSDKQSLVETIKACLMFPADFGGLPLSTYISHSVRGHDDKITLWIDIINTLREIDYTVYNKLVKIWQLYPREPAKSASQRTRLYEDPYCLNIRSLPSAESVIRGYTKSFLMSDEVTNPSIVKLYKNNASMTMERVVEEIDKIEPMYPQLANSILKNSNAGIIIRLMRTLTSSKTIERIIKTKENISLLDLIKKKNEEMIVEFRARMSRNNAGGNKTIIEKYKCSYSIAEHLRKISWGRELIGLTKPLFQHQVVLKDYDQTNSQEKNNSIYIQVSSQLLINPLQCHRSFGEFKPYVGSTTQEKVTKASIDVSEKTSYIKALLELGKTKTWLIMLNAHDVVNIVDIFINEKLDLVKLPDEASDVLDICSKVQSGNIFHRFKSQVEHSYAMVNCLAPVTSHFKQSSNPMASRTAGGIDLSIFYQYIYISNILALVEVGKFTKSLSPFYSAIFECESCTHVLPDANFTAKNVRSSGLSMHPFTNQVTKTISQPPKNIMELMSYRTGRILADNIDQNYELFHGMRDTKESTQNAKKAIVSLNDLRELDLKIIFCTAFLFSTHCQKVIVESYDFTMCLSFDQSFTYIGELLLDSGLLSEFLNMLGGKVMHHNMITTAHRLSGHISRQFKNFLLTEIELLKRKILSIVFKDDIGSWRIKSALRTYLLLLNQTQGQVDFVRLNHMINTSSNYGLIRKKLSIPTVFCSINPNDIITLWRSSNRLELEKPVIILRKISPPTSIYKSLNLDELAGYHGDRQMKKGSMRIQPLSFIARPLGRISSSVNKFLEVILSIGSLTNLRSLNSGNIYCLAEGSGGTLTTLLCLFPNMNGCYNTLMRHDIDGRDVATDCMPPAFLDVGLEKQKLKHLDKLSSGQTDILTTGFQKKLLECFQEDAPTIVTMDAESVNKSSNIEFVLSLMPVISKGNPKLTIFKLFWIVDFSDRIRDIVPETLDFVIVKPISSNPIGTEVYLVIYPKESQLINSGNVDVLKRIWKDHIGRENGYILDDMAMSEEQIDTYSRVAINVSMSLKSLIPDETLLLGNRYEGFIKKKNMCGLLCLRFLDSLMNCTDLISTNTEHNSVHVVVRESGTNAILRRLLHDILFLCLFLSKKETLGNIFSKLSMITIREEIEEIRKTRTELLIEISVDGKFWDTWGDAKMYCREIGSYPKCGCRAVRRWSIDQERLSLPWRMINDLRSANWIDGKVSNMRVVTRNEELLRKLKNAGENYGILAE